MARSGSPYSTPRDANRVPLLIAASSVDGVTPVVLEADPTTHALVTSGSGGGGGSSVIITDGTNSVNVLKSDGTAIGQNAELVAGTYLSVPFTTTSVAMIATTDVGNYRWVSVQIAAQGTSSSITFQSSNDNTNWQSNALTISSNTGTIAQTSSLSGVIYHGPVTGRYFRLNVTGISAGTTSGVIIFSSEPAGVITSNVNQNGTWSVTANAGTNLNTSALALDATLTGGTQQIQGNAASAATDSGNPVKIGGKYNVTKPTFTDGQRGDIQLGTKGSVSVQLYNVDSGIAEMFLADNADAIATSATANKMVMVSRNTAFNGTNWDLVRTANGASNTTGTGLMGAGQMVWDGTNWQKQKADTSGILTVNAQLYPTSTILNTYSIHLTSNTTTTPTASTAYISSISISSEIAGTTSTVTIQDKSGTPLKLVNGLSTTTLTTIPTIVNFQTPVKMTSGIDIITAGAVAATVDVWINYYQ